MSREICRKCNTEISNDFGVELEFCTSCGARLRSAEASPILASSALATDGPPVKRGSGLGYFFGIVVVILLVLLTGIGLLGYWLFSQKHILGRYTYSCTIDGEPPPVTSDDYYERAIKHYDTNTELSESERYDDCFFGALNQALRIDPGNADALALRGLGYLKEGNVDQAMADLNEAIEIAPDNFRAYQYRSEAHITVKEYEKAIQDTTKSIEVAPPNYPYFHTLYSNRASLYTQTGDHENAVKDYTEAINLKPAYWFNYSYRAKAYRELGKNDLAEADEKTVEMIMAEEGQLEDQIKRKLESQNAQEEPDKNSEDPINEVLELPRPKYPAVARMIEASGQVRVQIEVDTNGNVKSAEAVSGSPFLRPAAAEAARKAKFRPRRATGTFELIYTFEPELGEANVELRRQRSK